MSNRRAHTGGSSGQGNTSRGSDPVASLQVANTARTEKAKVRNTALLRIVNEIKAKTGITTLADIAQVLNIRGVKTARGHSWTASHVHFLLKSA